MNKKINDFICTSSQIRTLKGKLLPYNNQSSSLFIDPNTKDIWEKFSFWSEMKSMEYILYQKKDAVSVNDLVEMIINEKKVEILICACNELLRREKLFHSSFRELLLNGLEQLISIVKSLTIKEQKRIKLIIYESELYDATNKAPIMNRESSEIFKDAVHYRNFAKRAKNILSSLNNCN